MKLTRKQRNDLNAVDKEINELASERLAALSKIDRDTDESVRVVTRKFTESVKPIHNKKSIELKKWKSLKDAALRVVEKQYDDMLKDLHAEFSKSFSELEVGFNRQTTDIRAAAAKSRAAVEAEFNDKNLALLDRRRKIVEAAEKRDKEKDEVTEPEVKSETPSQATPPVASPAQ